MRGVRVNWVPVSCIPRRKKNIAAETDGDALEFLTGLS